MTLDTRIYVHGPVDRRELFVKCNQIIGAHEGVRFREDDDSIRNEPSQGLDAWLWIYARPEGPLVTPEQAAAHNEDCEGEDNCSWAHDRACWAKVSFDTAYSYQGPEGGCGDLHTRYVADLGQWLDGKGIRWQWQNEFTGELHWGFEGLEQLGSGGVQAEDWFRNIAAPAIAAHIAGGTS